MFGLHKFDAQYYDKTTAQAAESFGRMSFNGYDFFNASTTVAKIGGLRDHPVIHEGRLKRTARHGSEVTSREYGDKSISILGTIKGETKEELERNIRSMKRALGKEVGKFYFTKLDGTVLYTTAIVSTVIFPREHYHITYAPYEVVIESIDGLFFSVAKKEETIFGASAESTITIDNAEGTADAYPLIRATFLSAALATQLTISAGGVTITINDAISLGDAYEIDTKNVKVTKNGTQQIDYTGALHQLRVEPGEDTIVIDANGTRSADLSVIREDAHT